MAPKKGGGGSRRPAQTSDKVATLAAQVLSGSKKPTPKETRTLAASALRNDETKGKRKP